MDDSANPESGSRDWCQPENQGERPVHQVLQGVREPLWNVSGRGWVPYCPLETARHAGSHRIRAPEGLFPLPRRRGI